jgi:hypothetical protein
LRQIKFKHLIIVTDSFYTRRALYAFKKVFHASAIEVEAAATNEVHSEENWWHSDTGISVYLPEPIKFTVYILSSKNVSFVKNG